jgi:hypothetical protein
MYYLEKGLSMLSNFLHALILILLFFDNNEIVKATGMGNLIEIIMNFGNVLIFIESTRNLFCLNIIFL